MISREMEKLIDQTIWMQEYELRSKLSKITNQLKLSDQISLIFLMSPDPENGLKFMNCLFDESSILKRNNRFFKWLLAQKIFRNKAEWLDSFAEYLTLIEHKQGLTLLSLDPAQATFKYLPNNNFRVKTMSSIRKILYNLYKLLGFSESQKLICMLDHQFNIKTNDDSNHLKYKCMKWKLFEWSTKGFINLNENTNADLNALIPVLKSLNLENYANEIDVIVERAKTRFIREISLQQLEKSLEKFEFYPLINPTNLGYCVVINEKFFSNPVLTTRFGTEKDVERLIEVFTTFGFDVRVHSNLAYIELIKVLDHYARSVKDEHSAFVLIILSHGSENVIYSSDSEAVDINTIEMIFQADICPNLIGKPKIFIVQSCQGDKWQKQLVIKEGSEEDVLMDSSTANDGSQILTGPQRGDSIIAWSTVRGFASFRDRHNGSWYIEELCKELWKFGDVLDLVEILTRVNNNLRSKVHGNQFMVPCLLLSLRAKVKFPSLKEHEFKGKRIMLERLIFEKYFREFLTCETVFEKLGKLTEVTSFT